MINTLTVSSDGYLQCNRSLIIAVDGYLNTCSQTKPKRIRGRKKIDDDGYDGKERLILDEEDEIFSIVHAFLTIQNFN